MWNIRASGLHGMNIPILAADDNSPLRIGIIYQRFTSPDEGRGSVDNIIQAAPKEKAFPTDELLLLRVVLYQWLSLYNSSRPYTRDSLIQTKAGGAAPAPHRISKESAADQHQRLPHPQTTAGMQVLLLIASPNFCALTSQLAVHITPSLEHELGIPLQLCKSVGSAASWNSPQVDCKVPDRATSWPQTQQGHPLKYADEVGVDWSCFGGLRLLG
eukprot:890954-Pelagomonas_calceolata.AAC.2